jgi:hypothetical protein
LQSDVPTTIPKHFLGIFTSSSVLRGMITREITSGRRKTRIALLTVHRDEITSCSSRN